jgi:uncharacterized radical SAM protein YgiQ
MNARLPIVEAEGEPPRPAASADLLALAERPRRSTEVAEIARDFLPASADEIRARGWDGVDVVFVSGDAYVDHPSFAAALLGRVLEAAGFRVAILAQPDWQSVDPFLQFGAPRLFWAVSAGNMDSMINHYTASRRLRGADAYSPGGRIGLRPDRATNVYVQRCREANGRLGSRAPVVAGGVEASLRRLAHYDYWSDSVRPSILASSKADLLVHGMGEAPILEIARRLQAGEGIRDLRGMRSTARLLGKSETPPAEADGAVWLPSCEDVAADKRAFARATFLYHEESNALNGRVVVQRQGDRHVVQYPPHPPLSEREMDAIYDLPYARRPHPRYREPIPAFEMIRDSVTIMRGCFGGCTFCSITMHQGRPIQSRSEASVLRELRALPKAPGFSGIVSDIGGPTANMWKLRCTRPDVEARCRRPSCVHPGVCKLLGTDHKPLIQLMKKARAVPGIRRVHVASGVRMDLAAGSPEYLDELCRHHVGGHLKVAPEHASDRVLRVMRKPSVGEFARFDEEFRKASARAGKEQYTVPYFIASHPGSDLDAAVEMAEFLRQNGYRPQQVQDFIPAPMDVATAIYWTGLDPRTLEPVPVARALRDRRFQRALLQYWKPENWYLVREALQKAGRGDLIGDGPGKLISSRPPPAALEAKRKEAQRELARRGGLKPAAAAAQPPGAPHGERAEHGEDWTEAPFPEAPPAAAPRARDPRSYRPRG